MWQPLGPEQKQAVAAVAVALWEPFIQRRQAQVPEADLVPGECHVSQYLGAAVGPVRRQAHKELRAQGDPTLKGPRPLGL